MLGIYIGNTVGSSASPWSQASKVLFGRMTSVGETPTNARKHIIDRTIKKLVSAGLWSKLDCLWLTAAHGTASAKLNWIKNSSNLEEVGTLTFTTDRGYTGDGSTGYLKTNYIPATDGVKFLINDCSFGAYARLNKNESKCLMGGVSNTNRVDNLWPRDTNLVYAKAQTGGTDINVASLDSRGLHVCTRTGANSQHYYKEITKTSNTTASTGLLTKEHYILAYNNDGAAAYFSTNEVACALEGGSLSDAEVILLNNIIVGYYLRSVGAEVSKVVGFGDSITFGNNASDAAHQWLNIVATTKGYLIQNSGIAGTVLQNTVQNTIDTIGAGADSNGRDTYITRVKNYSPSHICIMYGLNDLRFNDVAFSVDNYGTDLGEMVDALISNGTPAQNIIIGSPPYVKSYVFAAPWDAGSTAKHRAYAAKCAAVATAKGTKYIDIYQYMIDNGGNALIDSDNLHPVDAGHAAIAAAFLSVM